MDPWEGAEGLEAEKPKEFHVDATARILQGGHVEVTIIGDPNIVMTMPPLAVWSLVAEVVRGVSR